MKIVIIGDGKVGYKLAEHLSKDNYDVVLIDNNEEKLKEAINNLDINCFAGDGVSVEVQTEAGVPEADLVIACASTDEQNMLSCLIARRIGAKHTIARVRNPIYYQQIDILKEDLRLSMVINPEFAVANEIARNLIFPAASKVETFVKGRIELVEFPVRESSPLIGYKLADIYRKFQIKILICAVQRGKEVYIPDGDFTIHEGDKLHIAATHKEIENFFSKIGNLKLQVKKVMICGGGRVGFYLARQLCTMGMQVKIIEKDEARCLELCEELPKVTVIHGNGTDHELLEEEGIAHADAFVSLTGIDEENIITSMYAKTKNVSKIVTKVNEEALQNRLWDALMEIMQSYEFGFTAEEAAEYSRVAFEAVENSTRIEVGVEVDFDSMVKISEVLDPIIQSVDPDAYFDFDCPGIMSAYIDDKYLQ